MIEFTRRRGDVAIEATCHAPDWEGCYDQIRRILKPGGTVRLPSHFAHCASLNRILTSFRILFSPVWSV